MKILSFISMLVIAFTIGCSQSETEAPLLVVPEAATSTAPDAAPAPEASVPATELPAPAVEAVPATDTTTSSSTSTGTIEIEGTITDGVLEIQPVVVPESTEPKVETTPAQ